jgi:hypothetical protein
MSENCAGCIAMQQTIIDLQKRLEEAARGDAFWMSVARQFCKNMEYYRSLVDRIGILFGEAAYISDDGSKQDDILRAKVPELVESRLAALESANARQQQRTEEIIQSVEDVVDTEEHLNCDSSCGKKQFWDRLRKAISTPAPGAEEKGEEHV